MLIKPIYEFLLWDNCNNNCKFCFQRKHPRLFDLNNQKKILNYTLQFLTSDKYQKNSHVLLVGGELFDDINRQELFLNFFNTIVSLMLNNIIDLLYLNTNLCYSESCMLMLNKILKLFEEKKLLSRLKFTTSYDLEGRFKTEEKHKQFLINLNNLHTIKDLNIVTNIILTKQFCEKILDQSFNLFNFIKQNHTFINLIPYIILDENLAPSRSLIFKCLQYLYQINPQFIINWIQNIDLKQPRKMFYLKDNQWISCECPLSTCGHSVNFKRYSNANSCFVCDVKEVFNAII